MRLVTVEEAADAAHVSLGHAYKHVANGVWLSERTPRIMVLARDDAKPFLAEDVPALADYVRRHCEDPPHSHPHSDELQNALRGFTEAYEREVEAEAWGLLLGDDWMPPPWMPENWHWELAMTEARRRICHRATMTAIEGM